MHVAFLNVFDNFLSNKICENKQDNEIVAPFHTHTSDDCREMLEICILSHSYHTNMVRLPLKLWNLQINYFKLVLLIIENKEVNKLQNNFILKKNYDFFSM